MDRIGILPHSSSFHLVVLASAHNRASQDGSPRCDPHFRAGKLTVRRGTECRGIDFGKSGGKCCIITLFGMGYGSQDSHCRQGLVAAVSHVLSRHGLR